MTTAIRLLRVHQWAKNLLLVLPALAGHLPWSPLVFTLLAGFGGPSGHPAPYRG